MNVVSTPQPKQARIDAFRANPVPQGPEVTPMSADDIESTRDFIQEIFDQLEAVDNVEGDRDPRKGFVDYEGGQKIEAEYSAAGYTVKETAPGFAISATGEIGQSDNVTYRYVEINGSFIAGADHYHNGLESNGSDYRVDLKNPEQSTQLFWKSPPL